MAGTPEPLAQAERTIDTDVTRLATLTRDNPTQQANVQQLRQNATRTLAAIRAQWEAKRGARAASQGDAETARAGMDAEGATLRAMRGSGLGLPTTKRPIEAHRENITIACPTAGGTIVSVELPASGAVAVM